MVPKRCITRFLARFARLAAAVASHPDIIGRPGLPNRWPVPQQLHRSMHPRYNQRFKEELTRLEGEPDVKDVLRIRDRLAKEFGIDEYRP